MFRFTDIPGSPGKALFKRIVEAVVANDQQMHLASGDDEPFDVEIQTACTELDVQRQLDEKLAMAMLEMLDEAEKFQL